jgi:hypothetical protein
MRFPSAAIHRSKVVMLSCIADVAQTWINTFYYIKQRHFEESVTKHFVRSHDKNAENAIFRTRDESTSILGEINNCWSKGKREAPYAVDGRHQKCNWTLIKWPKSGSEKNNQGKETDQCLIQGDGNGKPLLWKCCLVYPQGSPGVAEMSGFGNSECVLFETQQ